jgi:hypothetical protein
MLFSSDERRTTLHERRMKRTAFLSILRDHSLVLSDLPVADLR